LDHGASIKARHCEMPLLCSRYEDGGMTIQFDLGMIRQRAREHCT
jgi:hypothetical protein